MKGISSHSPLIPTALRITLIYLFFGVLWVLFSDRFLLLTIDDPELLIRFEMYKGWAFLGVTAVLLHSMINRSMKEQAASAENLRRSEEKFQTILDRAMDAIFVSDLDAHLLHVNRQACESLGYSREEILGLSIEDIEPEFSLPKAQNFWLNLSEEKTRTVERKFRRKDGSLFPVEIHIGRLEIEGRPVILGIARDISDRKKAERAMEKARLEWSTAMDASNDVVYILDLDRRLLRANTSFYRMTGLTAEKATGMLIEDIVHPQEEKMPCPVCRAQREKRDMLLTMEADHPDNPAGRPLEISVKIVRDRDGTPLSILVSLHDLSNSRKEMEEKARLETQLRQAQKMEAIGTLAGGIAHDFNNILTAILGYAELAREKMTEKDPPAKDLGEVIKAGCRARELVKYILTFARQDQQTAVALHPQFIVKESLQLLRASIPSSIEIRQEIDEQCGAIVADPSRLQQVMMNLSTNALQAMENEKGVLQVSLVQRELNTTELENQPGVEPGPFVELTISDTGCGMDSDTMARIFDPYFTTKEFGKGTGIGLALVHGIVSDCGGFIRVESEVGKGTTFSLYFPLADLQPEQISCEGLPSPLPAGSERILFVDDEQSIIDFAKSALEELGYTVTTAGNSTEALQIFNKNPKAFDLLITDQTMPNMTGLELAHQVTSIQPELPVILCTGYSAMVTREKMAETGIRVLATKPFTTSELVSYVRTALDKKKPTVV